MKVCCVGYRKWALKIYDFICSNMPDDDFYIIRNREEYNEDKIREYKPDCILFYGWSWMVSEKMVDDFECIMLHPSELPRYRGGSPIQNQIINGDLDSAVTLFVMDGGVDTGDIIAQEFLSLKGHLCEIFERIYEIGCKLTFDIFNNGYSKRKQDNLQSTYFPRRRKFQSEITLEELQTKDSEYLYNKIRMLEDPYPNAFIRTVDGKRILIKLAELEEEI